ncbi:PucR family transcriptional regulator [Corynebacterium casei]|uniref:PucR family transcriptional regulator n=1 Tax=Corynebacterium casei TaxID=160386 RepID=UPI003FD2D89D
MLEFEWLFNQGALEINPICPSTAATFSGVQTNELEDATEFIQQDSVVLTIAIAFANREDELAAYLAHLAEAGAVAVGIGTGLIFPTVPESVIATAQELGIGLFEVPRQISFISIVAAVHQEQSRRNDIAQRRLLAAQEKLTHTATRGNLTELLHEAAYFIDVELSIINERDDVVASTAPPAKRKYFSSYEMTSHGERQHTLKVDSDHPINPEDRSLIRHCAGLADMLLARPVELRQARNELNSFALRLSLGLPDTTSPSQMLPTTLDFPRDKEGFTRPVVALADDTRSLERGKLALDANLEDRGQFLYVAQLDPLSFLFLFRGDAELQEMLDLFAGSLRRLRVAIGKRIHATELSSDHVEELVARARPLPLGEYLSPRSQSMPWLNSEVVRTALASRRRETINVLRTIDAERNLDLARTLSVYLRKGGQLNQTAEALKIHRHTARNRIAQIEQLCEVDLSEPAVFAELLFAIVQDSDTDLD